MSRSVALVSMYPLDNVGGGERYTFDTFTAIRSSGDSCRLFARQNTGPGTLPLHTRRNLMFLEWSAGNTILNKMSLYDLLLELSCFDVIWVHQFLSSDCVFDVIAATAMDQLLFFTNLGHEVLVPEFRAFYCRAPNHCFIEISEYSAERSKAFRGNSLAVTGSIWLSQFPACPPVVAVPGRTKICSVGRVLPHKGMEITIAALPEDWELTIIGPLGDNNYREHLEKLSAGKRVRFLGSVTEEIKRLTVSRSSCLVASSCHETYLGQRLSQAELLGLVIFEAVILGVLPITSDIPSFSEIMSRLGLGDFVYPERDPQGLERMLHKATQLGAGARRELLDQSSKTIRSEYTWDSYWQRVLQVAAPSQVNR